MIPKLFSGCLFQEFLPREDIVFLGKLGLEKNHGCRQCTMVVGTETTRLIAHIYQGRSTPYIGEKPIPGFMKEILILLCRQSTIDYNS